MPSSPTQPYQPFLLRILHGLTGLFVILAIATALWTYDTYDGRWFRVYWPRVEAIEGIHGTFGLWALLIFPVFVVYAVHRGSRRLVQPDLLTQIQHLGQPRGRYALHRVANTLALIALAFAVFSGKMMDDQWLPRGELDHGWYYVHLISWVVMVVSIALHLLMSAAVGGVPLWLSMLSRQIRPGDRPSLWRAQTVQWWQGSRWLWVQHWKALPLILKVLEVGILLSVIAAWVISLLKEL